MEQGCARHGAWDDRQGAFCPHCDSEQAGLVWYEDEPFTIPPPAPRTETPHPADRRQPRSYAGVYDKPTTLQYFLALFGFPTLVGTHRTGVPWVTWLIALALIGIHVAATSAASPVDLAYPARDPRVWLAMTAVLAHANWLHLLNNLWGLMVFGAAMEQAVPKPAYLLSFLGIGIVSTLVQGLVLPAGSPILGASGAILGALAACLFLQPQASVTLGIGPVVLRVPMLLYMVVYGAMQISGLLGGEEGIAWIAHLTGMALGLAIGRFANDAWPD